MKDGKQPNPNTVHPIAGYDREIYVKPTVSNPNIIVGEFTYIADFRFIIWTGSFINRTGQQLPAKSSIRNCRRFCKRIAGS